MLGFRNRVIENLNAYLSEKGIADLYHATDKEIGEFHARFCPFVHQIYRGALIVTGHPNSANQLQVDIYLKAFMEYFQNAPIDDFQSWLAAIAHKNFSAANVHRSKPLHNHRLQYAARNPLGKVCTLQKAW